MIIKKVQERTITAKILICIFLFALQSCLRGSDHLAEFFLSDSKKYITRSELLNLVNSMEIHEKSLSIAWQKSLVKELALQKIASHNFQDFSKNAIEHKAFIDMIEANNYRKLLLKKWVKQVSLAEHNVYRVQHILLKLPAEVVQMAPSKKKSEKLRAADRNLRNQLLAIAKQILSKKMTFDEASKKYSDDEASKIKNGNLGYMPATSFPPQMEVMLDFFTKKNVDNIYAVISDLAPVYTSPSKQASTFATLTKYSIVKADNSALSSNTNAKFIRVLQNGIKVGYVAIDSLQKLKNATNEKISIPFKTIYGWHLMKLLDVQKMNKKSFARHLVSLSTDKQKITDEIAQQKATMHWRRIIHAQNQTRKQKLFLSYGLDPFSLTSLPETWEKLENVFKNDKMTITKKMFQSILNSLNIQRGINMRENSWPATIFKTILEAEVYLLEGRKEKLNLQKSFKVGFEFEKNKFLFALYKQNHWFSKLQPTKEELENTIKTMIEKYGEAKINPPSIKKIKADVINRIKNQKKAKLTLEKEAKLLEKNKFKIDDELFRIITFEQ